METIAHDNTLNELSDYVHGFDYDSLPPEVIWKAKAHLIDTLGAILTGYASNPSQLARDLAPSAPRPTAAAILGSDQLAQPDMAAFANAIAARGVDTLDAYHRHGKVGHPADTVAPLLTVADYSGASGQTLIAALVLAYEVFCWLRDNFEHKGFDNTNCARLGAAAGVSHLLGLDRSATEACLSIAAATDNVIKEVRSRPAAMTRETAAGYQARGAVFAGLLASLGLRGLPSPLDGDQGWLALIADGSYDATSLGGDTQYRILDTWLKLRPIPGAAYPIVIVTEKLLGQIEPVQILSMRLDVYGKLFKGFGSGEKRWNPTTRDTADHSAPFIVSTILAKGGLSLRSFDADHISDAETRALLPKIEVTEDPAFTAAYADQHEHRARLTVHTVDGQMLVAETGGDDDDFSAPRTTEQVDRKFLWLTDGVLSDEKARAVLSAWWQLETVENTRDLVADLTIS